MPLFPDDMAHHNLLIPISMLVEWDAKKGHLPPVNFDDGGALIGVFVSLDMFVFYAFWELIT